MKKLSNTRKRKCITLTMEPATILRLKEVAGANRHSVSQEAECRLRISLGLK